MEEQNEGTTVINYNMDTSGIEDRLDTVNETLTEIHDTFMHRAMDTPISEYTVTEGLLLLLLICIVINWCAKMIRRGFSWLL